MPMDFAPALEIPDQEIQRRVRGHLAETNRPSSAGASSTGLTAGNPPRTPGAVSAVSVMQLPQQPAPIPGADRRCW